MITVGSRGEYRFDWDARAGGVETAGEARPVGEPHAHVTDF